MLALHDDYYFYSEACQLVDKLFENVTRENDVLKKAQIYGLRNICRHGGVDEVLTFLNKQIERLSKQNEDEHNDQNRIKLEIWQSLRDQLTKGKIAKWAEKKLPDYLKQDEKAWGKEYKRWLDEAFATYVVHFSCHYFYRLTQLGSENEGGGLGEAQAKA